MDTIDSYALLGLVFITLATVMTSSHVPKPYFPLCVNDKINYTQNSPFENNLKILLEFLSTKASREEGFYRTSVGNGSNQVFGEALCRGDINQKLCQNCLENAAQEIMTNCSGQEAIYWFELCQVRYSYSSISSDVYTGKFPPSDNEEETVSDPINFPVHLKDFMHNLSYKGVSSKLMFATGKLKFSKIETIYGLVQCIRNISGEKCSGCLDMAITELDKCCSSRKGGTVFGRSCNVRFESYQFFEDSSTRGNAWKIWVVASLIALALVLVVLLSCCVFHLQQKKARQKDDEGSHDVVLEDLGIQNGLMIVEAPNIVGSQEVTFMEFSIIKEATDNFSDTNKLGQGGFGTVYKDLQGTLPDGKEIAVKRLSRKSWQGLGEFKNEILLMAELQHRNLVRLLGCGIEGAEKLVLYEFMPNKSLDVIIFDSKERSRLDWDRFLIIIFGIARGLLYLHEESRLKIIHRDLKPSNILLDHQMAAKISDFGMARIFGEDQNTANTRRVVGTYGYMAPEYAMEGHFSVKSDVFSFGVILLEIISGKKNSGFYLTARAPTLLAYAWQLWNEGRVLEFADPLLRESCYKAGVTRCIHIGLLCVQEDPTDRPTMSSIVDLLQSETIELPQPMQPAFPVGRVVPQIDHSSSTAHSVNHLTVSSISPR